MMRDRLIELLKTIPHGVATFGDITENLYIENVMTKHLLENGVIVPPCKVGDTVYCIIKGFSGVMRGRVCSFILTDKKTTIHCAIDGYFGQDFPYCEFGKTVFLTKEEAEQALKGGVEE